MFGKHQIGWRGAERIYDAAAKPKELRLLTNAEHGLTAACDEILELLMRWIQEQLGRPPCRRAVVACCVGHRERISVSASIL